MKWTFWSHKDDEGYIKTIRINKIEFGNGNPLKIKGKNVVVFRNQNKIYVFENNCPHRNLQIDKGYFKKSEFICHHHNRQFNPDTCQR